MLQDIRIRDGRRSPVASTASVNALNTARNARALDIDKVQLPEYSFRRPDKSDGAAIWELVDKGGVLDVNSPYSYLMMGEYFADTCRVAYRGGRLAGFVAGFTPPRRPDTLFVWQIGVHPEEQGRGLGKRILRDLLATPACGHLRFLEATVTPSNQPSEGLFRGIAADLDVPCRIEEVFAEDDFPGDEHESERRFRIGPIPKVGRALDDS